MFSMISTVCTSEPTTGIVVDLKRNLYTEDQNPFVRSEPDVDSYETKILRARAYVDVLAMSESNSPRQNQRVLPVLFNTPDTSVSLHSIYLENNRFSWMKPFEFYECEQEIT